MTIGRIPSVEGGIQPTIVDAKGDLIAGVAADSINRLAVGSNDQVLVADSSTSTGLAWKSVATPFAAGKNKIINGDFGIWQRGTSFTNIGAGNYAADRWMLQNDVNPTTQVISQQTFAAGTAPVAGYEGTFFLRNSITTVGSCTTTEMQQRIEDVRTFAGQTVTLSFWAKADSTRTGLVYLAQSFGSGGSAVVYSSTPSLSLTTSWQRFTYTFTLGSMSGKTIGAGSYLVVAIRMNAASGASLDIWGVQLEAGSVATPFQTATGTLQGELAACQRYYVRLTPGSNIYGRFGMGKATSSTNLETPIVLPVPMRVAPTSVEYASVAVSGGGNASAFGLSQPSPYVGNVDITSSGLTTDRTYIINAAGLTTAYIGFSAEL